MSTVSLMARKAEALRASGTLHPEPARVIDPLFQSLPFFDGRDLVQVKYEMLRRVEHEHASIQTAATALAYFSHLTNQIERRKKHRHGNPSQITFIQDSNKPQNKAMTW